MLRQPTPDDGVVGLLLARTLDDESHGDVITGNRQITNGPDCERMALKIAQLSHGKVDENAINAEPTYEWNHHAAHPYV